MDELASGKDAWHRYYYAANGSVFGRLKQADRPWLEAMVADDRHSHMKEVALQGLLALWTERGRPPQDIAEIRGGMRDQHCAVVGAGRAHAST